MFVRQKEKQGNLLYTPYGIHTRKWKKYKNLVIKKNLTSKHLKEKFDLSNKQVWFLYDKLLRREYDSLYEREEVQKEDIKIGDYVHCKEYGKGYIASISEMYDLMAVKFENKKHPISCSTNGYTVHDEIKRKVTKL